jgi:hypothetical protein
MIQLVLSRIKKLNSQISGKAQLKKLSLVQTALSKGEKTGFWQRVFVKRGEGNLCYTVLSKAVSDYCPFEYLGGVMGKGEKRFAKFLWIALLLVLALVACGGSAEPAVVEVTRVVTTVGAPLPTVTPTPDFGSLAYDVPKRMIREEAVQVILLVSPSEDDNLLLELDQELEEVQQQPSNVVTATIKMAKRMSVSLAAVPESAFEIVPLQANDEQLIYDDKPTQWEWTVLPKEGGTHRLILRIDRLVEMEGIVEHLREEVYRDDITVEVPLWLSVKDASAGLFSLNGLVGLLVVALVTALFTYWLSNRGKD